MSPASSTNSRASTGPQLRLFFFDEVSFDSRDMRRRYGYSPLGQKLVVRGDTGRSQRISLLCFQGVDGLLGATEGTFTCAVLF